MFQTHELVCFDSTTILDDNWSIEDFCDAAFKCGKPCPSGYDADCDVGERCFANTPCDASNTLSYGLPRSAMNLALQYIPQERSTGTIEKYIPVKTTVLMALFVSLLQ